MRIVQSYKIIFESFRAHVIFQWQISKDIGGRGQKKGRPGTNGATSDLKNTYLIGRVSTPGTIEPGLHLLSAFLIRFKLVGSQYFF